MAQGFYGNYMGNAGALSDLVYRGNPGQMMPMPYYGGGMGVQKLGGFPGPGQLSTDVIKANIPAPYGGNGMGVQQLRGFAGPGQLSTDVIEANIPGSASEQLLSQGIPVGQDPRFPMDQKMFEAYVEERRFKNKYPNPGDFRRFVDQYNKNYFPGSQATLPADIGGKTVS